MLELIGLSIVLIIMYILSLFEVRDDVPLRDLYLDKIDINKDLEGTKNKLNEMRKPDSFRPQNFNEYIGQNSAKRLLSIAIESSVIRQTAIDHVLLTSRSPGMGKTTLALIIANLRAVPIKVVTASNLTNPSQIFALFTDIKPNQIIFIDEIHRLSTELSEILYSPLEDNVIDNGTEQVKLPPFTLIGATAGEEGLLPKPLLDRFAIKIPLEDYTLKEICQILKNLCKKMDIILDDKSVENVSRRSCYNPRISNMLLKRVRDYCIVRRANNLNEVELDGLFSDIGIDKYGLDCYARLVLQSIFNSPKEAMGLTAIARVTGISSASISEKYEPVLVRLGFLSYSAKGRVLTQFGKDYILKDKEIINENSNQEKIEVVEKSIKEGV